MDPQDVDEGDEPLTRRNWAVFFAGLALYVVGFFLLARGLANLAPFLIVGGIAAMVIAFLI